MKFARCRLLSDERKIVCGVDFVRRPRGAGPCLKRGFNVCNESLHVLRRKIKKEKVKMVRGGEDRTKKGWKHAGPTTAYQAGCTAAAGTCLTLTTMMMIIIVMPLIDCIGVPNAHVPRCRLGIRVVSTVR